MSTNDTSNIISKIAIPKHLKIVKDTLDGEIEQGPINYYNYEQEMKNFLSEFIENCDKLYNNNNQENKNFFYDNRDDIKLKFIEKKNKKEFENEYNIIDNYNIITKTIPVTNPETNPKTNPETNPKTNPETNPKTETPITILLNKRSICFEEEICNESYQINQKIKLHEDILLIVLIKKKGEEKEKEKKKEEEEEKEKEKDEILILLIKEKRIRDKKENKSEEKKKDEEEKNFEKKDKDKKEDQDEFGYEGNKNIKSCFDPYFHILYKKYNFSFEIPQVGKNFSSYLLSKNGKEEIILFFWHEKIIYFYKIENFNDDFGSIITKYIFNLDFEPILICPIKNIKENKFFLEKDIVFYSEYFLIFTKENLKLCKYIEEISKLFICNVEYEFNQQSDQNLFEGKILNNVEHLDNGIIAFHFKDQKNEEIAFFYLYCKDYFYNFFYKKMMFKIFLFKLKKKINNN